MININIPIYKYIYVYIYIYMFLVLAKYKEDIEWCKIIKNKIIYSKFKDEPNYVPHWEIGQAKRRGAKVLQMEGNRQFFNPNPTLI